MDKYLIDNEKLKYHPIEVSNWLQGKNIYPIFVEISPVNYCQQNCCFCGLDYKHGKTKLNPNILCHNIEIMAEKGVKSIMFAGAGEPMLYKELPEVIKVAKKAGLDIGLTTNGALIKEKDMCTLLENLSWIKISVDAGDPGTYKLIHGVDDYIQVRNVIAKLGYYKKTFGYNCTLGTQALLLPDNYNSIEQLIVESAYHFFDYCVIKPYSQHLSSNTKKYQDINYSEMMFLKNKLEQFNSDIFQVIFRTTAMSNKDQEKTYQECYSVPHFWAYIECDGNVWSCSCFLDKDKKFLLGNINDKDFSEIWDNRDKNIKIDVSKCRDNCRMEMVNRYLWQVKHPEEQQHINFI